MVEASEEWLIWSESKENQCLSVFSYRPSIHCPDLLSPLHQSGRFCASSLIPEKHWFAISARSRPRYPSVLLPVLTVHLPKTSLLMQCMVLSPGSAKMLEPARRPIRRPHSLCHPKTLDRAMNVKNSGTSVASQRLQNQTGGLRPSAQRTFWKSYFQLQIVRQQEPLMNPKTTMCGKCSATGSSNIKKQWSERI